MEKNEKIKIWDLYGGSETTSLTPKFDQTISKNSGVNPKTATKEITKMNESNKKIDIEKRLQQILNYKPKQLQEKKIKIGNIEFYAPINQVNLHEFDKFIPSTTIDKDI